MVDGSFGIDLIFYLDGQQAGRFTDPQTTEFAYKYNQLYFSAENLEEKSHSFKLQNGETNGPRSVVLFDYIKYTKYVRSTDNKCCLTCVRLETTVARLALYPL